MKHHDKAPNGHFAEGLILYGKLEAGAMASKGFILEPPDMQQASAATLNERQDKIRIFLASLSGNQRAQLQWTCHSDYRTELQRYRRQTLAVDQPYIRRVREERHDRYWQRMIDRKLRREQLVLFLTQDIETSSPLLSGDAALRDYYEKTLAQLRNDFAEYASILGIIFGHGTVVRPMGDLDHFIYYRRFLNPSINEKTECDFESLFDSQKSLQELAWDGDGIVIKEKGFLLDDHYNALFTLKRWPQKTYPGIIHRLTSLPFLDYQITVNIEPIAIREEILREEKAIDRLRGDYQSEGKQSLAVSLKKKERKIELLAQGFSFPFNVEYVIRVTATTTVKARAFDIDGNADGSVQTAVFTHPANRMGH